MDFELSNNVILHTLLSNKPILFDVKERFIFRKRPCFDINHKKVPIEEKVDNHRFEVSETTRFRFFPRRFFRWPRVNFSLDEGESKNFSFFYSI